MIPIYTSQFNFFEHVVETFDGKTFYIIGAGTLKPLVYDGVLGTLTQMQLNYIGNAIEYPAEISSHASFAIEQEFLVDGRMVKNECIYVFGGCTDRMHITSRMFVINVSRNEIFEIERTSAMTWPDPRCKHGGCYMASQKKYYMFGGMNNEYHQACGHLNDFWVFDVGSHSWSEIDVPCPTPRCNPQLISLGEKVYLYSGYNKGYVINDLYEFNGSQWTCLRKPNRDKTFGPKYIGNVFVINDLLHILSSTTKTFGPYGLTILEKFKPKETSLKSILASLLHTKFDMTIVT